MRGDRAAGGHSTSRRRRRTRSIIHDDLGTNDVVHWSPRRRRATRASSSRRPVIVQERYDQPRLIPNAMEPRGCLAYGVAAMDEWTLGQRHPDPAHREGDALRASAGIARAEAPVIAPDVGGGFGSKLNVYAEEALALALAEASGRPVKWIERPPGELRGHDPRPRRARTTARWPAPRTARSSG